MITVCAGAADCPVQAGLNNAVLKYTFCQRAPANISQANHQDFHGRKDMELTSPVLSSDFSPLLKGGKTTW
jgi:hypothetical protein